MTARLPTMVTLHDTRFVEYRWWNDGSTENCRDLTIVGLHDTGPRFLMLVPLKDPGQPLRALSQVSVPVHTFSPICPTALALPDGRFHSFPPSSLPRSPLPPSATSRHGPHTEGCYRGPGLGPARRRAGGGCTRCSDGFIDIDRAILIGSGYCWLN